MFRKFVKIKKKKTFTNVKSKNYFEVNRSNTKASFKITSKLLFLTRKEGMFKKIKSPIKQIQTAKKPKHLILVTLVGRKRRKICQPTSEAIGQGANTISKTPYLTRNQFLSKNQRALSNRKTTKLSQI